MRKFLFIFTALFVLLGAAGCGGKKHPELFYPRETQVWPTADSAEVEYSQENLTKVEINTTLGPIVLELFDDKAPISVANFLQYVQDGFYDGTIFHRIEPGMVVQGGGLTAEMKKKKTRDPILNEAGNGLRNMRGTVGVARSSEMTSGTSQFYINLVDNSGFNGNGRTGGYAIFGRVAEGMDVVDNMAMVQTKKSVPVEPVIILSARVLE